MKNSERQDPPESENKVDHLSGPETSDEGEDEGEGTKSPEASFRYVFTPSVPALLNQIQASLWVSTYQAGKLAVFRPRADDKLSLLLRTFDKAMGFAFRGNARLDLGTRIQVWSLMNHPELGRKIEPKDTHDACFMPRQSHVTGFVDIHEMAWAGDELWFVNTLYSCLCTTDSSSSFVPRWQPPFITDLRKQDRCHLNGLAMADGKPKYVTAFAETDAAEGWREGDHKKNGGLIIDVESGEIVVRGLSMPHSPRLHGGELFALDSGNGGLIRADPATGKFETIASLPGFTRGLTFAGPLAFVGLSRVREKKVFGGVPITDRPEERKCGVWVIDIRNGNTIGIIEFEETVDEVFDVHLLPGLTNPAILGFEKDAIAKRCVIGKPNEG